MRLVARAFCVFAVIFISSAVWSFFSKRNIPVAKFKTEPSVVKHEKTCHSQRRIFKPPPKIAKCDIAILNLVDSFDIPIVNPELISELRNDKPLALIQVINGTIFTQSENEQEMVFERDRREDFLKMLSDSLPFLAQKDFELLLSTKDCCTSSGPVFSVTRCDHTQQIPYVQWNKIRDGPFSAWNRRMRRARERVKKTPWVSRRSTAVFRGSVARKWSFDEDGYPQMTSLNEGNWRKIGRTILAHIANETGSMNYLDVKLRYVKEKLPNFPFAEAEDEMPMEVQAARFKYTVIVEGNCGWADRFKSFLSMGSLCFVQTTPCREYYSLLARPFIDYVPVAGNLQNLTEAIEWARSNDQEAQRVAHNGIKFSDRFLTETTLKLGTWFWPIVSELQYAPHGKTRDKLMRNNSSFLQGRRLPILIASSVVSVFVIGGCIAAIFVGKSWGAKGDVNNMPMSTGSEHGTMLFCTKIFDEVGQQLPDESVPGSTETQLQATPTDLQSQLGVPQPVEALQGTQIEPPIFQIGSISLTKKKLVIMAVVAAALLLLSVAGVITGFFSYRNHFEMGLARIA